MKDAFYDYARYDGDSRSSWEKLTWVVPRHDNVEIKKQTDIIVDLTQEFIIENSVMYVEIKIEKMPMTSMERVILSDDQGPRDRMDLNWKHWDLFDFLSVFGVIFIVVGFVLAIFP